MTDSLTRDQGEEIIRLLRALVELQRTGRAARSRKRIEANRARAIAEYRPTELQIAAARRALLR